MKIPNKLKIGAFEWEVEENAKTAMEGNCFGSTHPNTQQIFLDPASKQQKKEETLLHEVMHVVWWQTGLSERYRKTPEIEEEIVKSLSHGLYQALKDNKFLK